MVVAGRGRKGKRAEYRCVPAATPSSFTGNLRAARCVGRHAGSMSSGGPSRSYSTSLWHPQHSTSPPRAFLRQRPASRSASFARVKPEHLGRGVDEGGKDVATHQNIAEWFGKTLVDPDGERIGKLEDVYVDVETDEPMFGTVKEGLIGRHLTFVPLGGIEIGPDNLRVRVSKEKVKEAPNIELRGRGAVPGRREGPLPLLRAQLHAAGHRERAAARAPLI